MKRWILAGLFVLGSVTFAVSAADGVAARGKINPTVITNFSVDVNPAIVGETLTFSIAATTGAEGVLSYSIDFGDGSFNAVQTGSLVNGAATLTYNYYTAGLFTANLSVSDGSPTAPSVLYVNVLGPNNGGNGIPNISNEINTNTDPDDGVTVMLYTSNGGVIQLLITEKGTMKRFSSGFTTDWGDIAGRSDKVNGDMPVHQFTRHGVFTAKITQTPLPPPNGRVAIDVPIIQRRTLVIGSLETGENSSVLPPIAGVQRETLTNLPTTIATSRLRGRFNFQKKYADTVSLVGTIMLPAGFNTAMKHELQVGIGNVTGTINLDSRGTGQLESAGGLFAKAKVFFPNKGGKLTQNTSVRVDVLLAGKGLSAQGFDTEGISALHPGATGLFRQIQAGITLDGLPYQSLVPVSFSVDKDGAKGSFDLQTRR